MLKVFDGVYIFLGTSIWKIHEFFNSLIILILWLENLACYKR